MKSKPIVSERCRSWWWGTNFRENATFPMGTMTVDAKNNTLALHEHSTQHMHRGDTMWGRGEIDVAKLYVADPDTACRHVACKWILRS